MTIEKPAASQIEQEPVYLDEKQVSRLFFLSFRYSQGNAELQYLYFKYIHRAHPEWKISEEVARAAEESLIKPITKQTSGEHHKAQGGIRNETKKMMDMLHYVLNNSARTASDDSARQATAEPFDRNPKMFSHLVEDMAAFTICADTKYREGRPRYPPFQDYSPGSYDPAKDPFLSHLVWYGFLENKTGDTVYDDAFKEMVEKIREQSGLLTIDSKTNSQIYNIFETSDSVSSAVVQFERTHDPDTGLPTLNVLPKVEAIVSNWNDRHPDMRLEDWRIPSAEKEEE